MKSSVFVRRSMYLAYNLRGQNQSMFRKFQTHVRDTEGLSVSQQNRDLAKAVYRHNIAPMDYYQFEFFRKDETERATYAGTGTMYEHQLRMNPPAHRPKLEDKTLFLRHFSRYIKRLYWSVEQGLDKEKLQQILNHPSGKVVVKNAREQAGRGVQVLDAPTTVKELIYYMRDKGFDLVEEYVDQHADLRKLAPSSLNTVRVITELASDGTVRNLGVRMRIGVGGKLDNLAQGGIACEVDPATGRIVGEGYTSDITKPSVVRHPITDVTLIGFQIPFWDAVQEMTQAAAQMTPQCRSIGWDVAIRDDGIELIEGNHNWCKTLWQVPAQRGLKDLLSKE